MLRWQLFPVYSASPSSSGSLWIPLDPPRSVVSRDPFRGHLNLFGFLWNRSSQGVYTKHRGKDPKNSQTPCRRGREACLMMMRDTNWLSRRNQYTLSIGTLVSCHTSVYRLCPSPNRTTHTVRSLSQSSHTTTEEDQRIKQSPLATCMHCMHLASL